MNIEAGSLRAEQVKAWIEKNKESEQDYEKTTRQNHHIQIKLWI